MKDLAIEQIRETRRRISAAQGNNVENLVSYYIKLQEKYQQRAEKKLPDEKPEKGKLPVTA